MSASRLPGRHGIRVGDRVVITGACSGRTLKPLASAVRLEISSVRQTSTGADVTGFVILKSGSYAAGVPTREVSVTDSAQVDYISKVAEPVAEPERCDHVAESVGCALRSCLGVPDLGDVVDRYAHDVTPEPAPAECGTSTVGRIWAHAIARYLGDGAQVSMPRYADNGWCDRRDVRQTQVWDYSVNGHAVRVVAYETRSALSRSAWPYAAVWVDGCMVAADIDRTKADMVAWRIALAVRDAVESAGPVAQVDAEPVAQVDADAEPVDLGEGAQADAEPEPVDAEPVAEPEPVAQAEPAPAPVAQSSDVAQVDAEPITSEVSNMPTTHAEPVAQVDAEPAPAPVAQAEPVAFTVGRDALADALAYVAKIGRVRVPVMAGVMITSDASGVTVATFDYETARIDHMGADVAQVTGAGRVLVDVKTLNDMVKSLPKGKAKSPAAPVTVTEEGTSLVITSGPSRFTVPTLPTEDYPAVPGRLPAVGTVGAVAFAQAIAQVAPAVGTDPVLPNLTSLNMVATGSALELNATDRYRLGAVDMTWLPADADAEPVTLNVPAKPVVDAAKSFAKLTGAAVTIGRDTVAGIESVSVSWATRTLTVRTNDGEFPRVRTLLPNASAIRATATVNAVDLAAVVKRVIAGGTRINNVRLKWSADCVTVAAGSGDDKNSTGESGARESMPATYDGADGFTMAFNPAYLGDGLKATGTDRVRFAFTDADKPAVIRPVDADGDTLAGYAHLIMPIKILGNPDKDPAPVGRRTVAQADAEPVAAPPAMCDAEPVADVAQVAADASADITTSEVTNMPTTHAEPAPEPVGDVAQAEPVAQVDAEPLATLALTAVQNGDYRRALDAVDAGERLAPAYMVEGVVTWAETRAAIIADADAAGVDLGDVAQAEPEPEPVADAEPVAEPVAPVVTVGSEVMTDAEIRAAVRIADRRNAATLRAARTQAEPDADVAQAEPAPAVAPVVAPVPVAVAQVDADAVALTVTVPASKRRASRDVTMTVIRDAVADRFTLADTKPLMYSIGRVLRPIGWEWDGSVWARADVSTPTATVAASVAQALTSAGVNTWATVVAAVAQSLTADGAAVVSAAPVAQAEPVAVAPVAPVAVAPVAPVPVAPVPAAWLVAPVAPVAVPVVAGVAQLRALLASPASASATVATLTRPAVVAATAPAVAPVPATITAPAPAATVAVPVADVAQVDADASADVAPLPELHTGKPATRAYRLAPGAPRMQLATPVRSALNAAGIRCEVRAKATAGALTVIATGSPDTADTWAIVARVIAEVVTDAGHAPAA